MENRLREVTAKWQETRTILNKELIDITRTEIKEAIERRYKLLKSNPKQIINNILTRWSDPIILDRIVVDHENGDIPSILIHSEQVKKETAFYFFKWMEDHNPNVTISPEWMEYYRPRNDIKKELYEDIFSEFMEDKIDAALKHKTKNKASGPNNIPYEILKKLSEQGIQILTDLFNAINRWGAIPKAWKQTSIKLIPKPVEWMKRLDGTRSIILLDTCKKLYIFLITRCLIYKMEAERLLMRINWVGLLEGRTMFPIIALNNIIEDVKNTKRSIWILLQDIRWAFDPN